MQDTQKKIHDQLRTFTTADPVFVRKFGNKTPLWLIGQLKEQTGPLSYLITLDDGRVIRPHMDHIRSRTSTTDESNAGDSFDLIPSQTRTPSPVPSPPQPVTSAPRRSQRVRRPPERYSPSQ